MSNNFYFVIPGRPTGKARPRVTKWGTHNTETTVLYENLVKLKFQEAYKVNPVECPLKVDIYCYYGIPKGTSKIKTTAMLQVKIRPTVKPDVDNIAKIITDALNSVAYKDDKQIVELSVKKYYSDIEHVKVYIEEI